MDDLKKRYAVNDIFFHRYFIRNAENTFVNNLKRFMLWREGAFPNPKDKLAHVRAFLAEELEKYYAQGQFHIPQIGFSLTTRCTLRCQDCIALSQLFENTDHSANFGYIDTSIDKYKHALDRIINSVDGIKRLFLHGGEPLLNKELPEIVAYSAQCDKIELVELITNGTVVPSEALLDALEKYKHKIYLAINDYSKNPALRDRLPYKKIIALLEDRGIRHPLYAELQWFKQHPLKYQGYSPEKLKRVFADCWCIHSLQILDGVLAICPRASMGHLLGIVETPADDLIDLRCAKTTSVRQEFIDFYRKDSFAACGYCVPQTEIIPPAVQAQKA